MKILFITILLNTAIYANILTQEYESLRAADNDDHMLTAAPIGYAARRNTKYKSDVHADDYSDDSFGLFIGYAKRMKDQHIQLGLNLVLSYSDDDQKDDADWSSYIQVDGGLIFNFEDDLRNSAYVSGFIGRGTIRGNSDTETDLGRLTLTLGKRIQLSSLGLDHVSLNPNIAIVSTVYSFDDSDDDYSNRDFVITPVSFNFFL